MRVTRRLMGTLMSLLVIFSGGLSCTESGQIFTLVDEAPLGGAPTAGSGGVGAGSGGGGSGGGAGGALDPSTQPGPVGSNIVVEGGDLHTCAVVDGELFCWGDNQTGALGLGDFDARVVATRLGTSSGWSDIGCGDGFSCGIQSGAVWCWGRGSSGQLGWGQFSSSTVPVEVTLPEPAVRLGIGHEHACAILQDGRLYCWGQNTEGQLAQSDPWTGPGVNSGVPLQVGAGASWETVAAGQGHTCAIQTDGSLWCWGRNSRGELGQGADQSGQIRAPEVVGTASDWTYIAAGQNHTCGIRAGELYCWGDNTYAQVGDSVGDVVVEPILVPSLAGVQSVSVDTFHTCASDEGGSLHCWGRNAEGQLGDGTVVHRGEPTLALPSGNWTSVSAARFHSCGVRSRSILCTGDNAPGRLATGDTARRNEFTPTLVATTQ